MMTFKAAKQACRAIVIVAGATTAQATTQPPEGLPMIAREVVTRAGSQPQKVREAIFAALNDCLPEDARAALASAGIKTLIVDLQLISFEAASQTVEASDRQRQIDRVIDASRTQLTASERKDLEVLKVQALDQGVTLLCVAATARGLLESQSQKTSTP